MRKPALCALLLGLAAACGCAGAPPLVVASDLDNRPFAFVGDDGRPAGRDVEMMAALAGRLGRGLEWRRMPFEELLPAAEAGAVDVVCATLGITPERAERVAFTRPYFETGIAVVVRAGPGEPTGHGQLAGLRVAAAAGTTSERAVREHLPGTLPAAGGGALLERLLTREIDAAVLDGPDAERLVADGGGALLRLPDLTAERYALALPPDRRALLEELDRQLGELRVAGELAALDRAWGLAADARPGVDAGAAP